MKAKFLYLSLLTFLSFSIQGAFAAPYNGYIVKVKSGSTFLSSKAVSHYGSVSKLTSTTFGTFARLETNKGLSDKALQALANNPEIEYIEPNYIISLENHAAPRDSLFKKQWGLLNTGKNSGIFSRSFAHAFVALNTQGSFPLAMGVYSALLGFFIPSGGGKWLLEAPYVMQAANELKVHLGWAVQVYNAAEALPNLINPFFMLPLLGILGLKARDIVGFSFLQLIVHLPVVLFLLWALAFTLEYHPPVIPG